MLSCGLAFTSPAEAAKPAKATATKSAKPLVVKSQRDSKKTKALPAKSSKPTAKKLGKNAEKQRSAAPSEPPARVVALEKGETPARTELGCSTASAGLSAVGHVLKVEGKTFRCQKTWDYIDGKLVGYPAWVELFMPTPGWGAGLRETATPPVDAVEPVVPGATAKVAPLANIQPEVETKPAPKPASFGNELY